ncbi:MAG: hypothetical protein JW779_05105 [Candidatus Thorarchaeota archaeon]|nr:hypothetical protein [Candidatus Thorarchaeota archaeon]
MSECPICRRDRTGDDGVFCSYHNEAYGNLKHNFERWNQAFGGITWEEYLEKIDYLENTGQWVKEVIEYIMSEGNL